MKDGKGQTVKAGDLLYSNLGKYGPNAIVLKIIPRMSHDIAVLQHISFCRPQPHSFAPGPIVAGEKFYIGEQSLASSQWSRTQSAFQSFLQDFRKDIAYPWRAKLRESIKEMKKSIKKN